MEKTRKNVTLIMKIVGVFCNMKCRYCFYQDNSQQEETIMSADLLEKIIRQYLEINQPTYKFIWHGGEPTLAGITFFEKVIEFQEKHRQPGQIIGNAIQTNGTLINEDWATFFKDNDFGVGISLDGCKNSHNKFRRYANGGESFDDIVRGVKLLQSKNVRLGFIQTVAKSNLSNILEDFKFFTEELGIEGWGTNYYLDKSNCGMSQQTVTPLEMAAHVIQTTDLWLERNDANLKIREIEDHFHPFLNCESYSCDFNGSCGHFLCIDWNGDVYPCDRFSSQEEYLIGCLQTKDFSEILDGKEMQLNYQRTKFLSLECQKCKWLTFCQNGCVSLRVPDSHGRYYYCEARKKIFENAEKIATRFNILPNEESECA